MENNKIKKISPFKVFFHPLDSYEDMKYKKNGSVLYATILLAMLFIMKVLNTTSQGFIFNYNRMIYFNVLNIVSSTILVVSLFVISNWCWTTLFDGEGSLKEIYIVTCYSLLPMLIGEVLNLALSNFLAQDEVFFMQMITTICQGLFGLYLLIGLKTIHDFKFLKTIFFCILTVFGMIIIVFLIALFINMIQQVVQFISLIISEIMLRIR